MLKNKKIILVLFTLILTFTLVGCRNVSVKTNQIGQGKITVDGEVNQQNDTAMIKAIPAAGWKFKEWRGSLTGTQNPVEVVATGDMNITAMFEKAEFVRAEGDKFMLGDQEFKFVGTNNYYFHYKDKEMVDDVIEDAKAMGVEVIRIWGFLDGEAHDGNVMQPELGVYDESGFKKLDYAIKKAGEEGIKLLIPFVNNWNDFGGMNQYVKWVASADEHDDFYSNEEIKKAYKDYVKYLLNRKNTYTGLIYKEDPTIFSWELANEPRAASDKSGDTLVNWAEEMSAYVKSIDSNHLLAVGDEGHFIHLEGKEYQNINEDTGEIGQRYGYGGWEGVDWKRLTSLSNIDYGTVHLYPDHWGDDWSDQINAGLKWIDAHIEFANRINKPIIIEEYGINAESDANRDLAYDLWNQAVYENGGDGSMFWILSGIDTGSGADEDGLYPDYDGFRIVEGSKTANLLADYATLFNTGIDNREPALYLNSPKEHRDIKGEVEVKATVLSRGIEIAKVIYKTPKQEVELVAQGEGIYVGTWDTSKESEGEAVTGIVEAKLADGTLLEKSVEVTVRNKTAMYVLGEDIDFSNDLEGWIADKDTWISKAEHSNFNGGSLKADVNWPGGSWDETRVVHWSLQGLSDYDKVSFEIYLPKAGLSAKGKIKPYAVVEPGWSTIGMGDFDVTVADAKTVTIDGNEYLYIKCEKKFDMSGKEHMRIGIVGENLEYTGPVYLDNIKLYQKVYK